MDNAFDAFDTFFDTFFVADDYYRSAVGSTKYKEVDEFTSTLTMMVPGYGKEDLDVEYFKDKQIVSVKSKEENVIIDKKWKLHKYTDSIEASVVNGILSLTIKKEIPENAKPVKVVIT